MAAEPVARELNTLWFATALPPAATACTFAIDGLDSATSALVSRLAGNGVAVWGNANDSGGERGSAAEQRSTATVQGTPDALRAFAARLKAAGAEAAAVAIESAVAGSPRAGGRPAALRLRGGRMLAFGRKTHVMGIVNLTSDSFTDDGLGADIEAAVRRAEQMARDGADLIDIGAESSLSRDNEAVRAEMEAERIAAFLRRVRGSLDVPISVDTRKAVVARAALEAGADIVNDVSALRGDPELAGVVARAGCPVVLMHTGAVPPGPGKDLMAGIAEFFQAAIGQAVAAGIDARQIVIDAGFGFDKGIEEDLEHTRRLGELRSFRRPILHAPSRKRTIGRILGFPDSIEERLPGTAAAVAIGIAAGADIVRVHDVLHVARLVRVTDALVRGL